MYHYAPKNLPQQQQQQQLGEFNWIDALTDPDETINKYKAVAVKEGTMLLLMFAGVLILGNFFIVNYAVSNQFRKKR